MTCNSEEFFKLIQLLLANENDVRQQAETAYNEIPMDTKVSMFLMAILKPDMNENDRYVSAVLLRRLFTKDFLTFYDSLGADAQKQFKQSLLMAMQQDQSEALRKKVCDLIAEVVQNLRDKDGNLLWNEFLQFMFECLYSNNSKLKDSCLRVFICFPALFESIQEANGNVVKKIFENCLQRVANDPDSYEVNFQAVRALGAYLSEYEDDPSVARQLSCFLPQFMNIVVESVEKQMDDALLKVLIDVAEKVPKFLKPLLNQVINMNIIILANEEYTLSYRQLALEVIVVLTENLSAPVRRNCSKEISELIPYLLNMMTIIEDDEDFAEADDTEDDENDSINVIAEAAIDRICCGLGGKMMLPMIVPHIKSMLQNENWCYRHAALMAISAVGEGCKKEMEASLPEIVNAVVNFLKDSHYRVRFAACNAIGQMCSDFAPHFEKRYHDKIVPGLLQLLDDKDNPRVQTHAGAALVNFSEDCTKEVLLPYLDAIMEKLVKNLQEHIDILMKTNKKLVLSQTVTTVASVASTSGEHFSKYYEAIMPMMKFILKQAGDEKLKLLRGKTIECISLIGLAVGAEKFMPDANDILDMLLKIHTEGNLTESDPQNNYLISAWERFCKILGKDFVQFLPLVMEPIMRTASNKPEVAVIDKEEMDRMNENNEEDWQFVSLSEMQNFGVRTSGLEDKASACSMLVCYARELKEGFMDYAEEVCKLMVSLLKFYFHDGVRISAAESLPLLLECVKPKGQQYMLSMWEFIYPSLIKSVETEPEAEVIAEMISSLASCIEVLGYGCLSDDMIKKVMEIVDGTMKSHFEKASKRRQKQLEEDYDEVVESELEDEESEDSYMLSKVSELLHALLCTYKESFLPYFEQILGHINILLNNSYLWADHQAGLCIIDDLIEFTGPASLKYESVFMQAFIRYVQTTNAEVRQAAAYGWGLIGQFGGPQYANHCKEIMPFLIRAINEENSRSDSQINATENAISAVTKILKYNNSAVNADEIIPMWVNWLPVHEDEIEAPHVYGYLCDLVERNHPIILNNLTHLVAIIADVFERKTIDVDHEVSKRLIQVLRQIQSNESVFQSCVNSLQPSQKQALYSVLFSSN